MKSVVFCGKQNIPLRGHRDDAKHLANTDKNPGNFQALLEFRVDSGDTVLEKHFKSCPKTASYRSKTIQNEIIDCCGDYILSKVIASVKEAKVFSISCDEGTDIGNRCQLPLVIRYVDKAENHVKEVFVGFSNLDDRPTGEAVAQAIKTRIASLGLDLANCRYAVENSF